LVEQEYGRRLYASDLPYEEAMDQLSQKYLDSVKLIKQSEFKKPYLEDDYVPMEYAYYPTDWPTFAPVNPGDSITPDCKVGIEASGVLDAWRDCVNPEEDCSAWIFTCAHKLTQIMCGYCTIKKMTPLGGDRLEVIICSDGDSIDVKYQTTENPSKPTEWKKYEDNRECCPKGAISIGYTSQQMSCSGPPQTLTAVPPAQTTKVDLGDLCYTWSVSGGGSLNKAKGNSVVYTPPATNANCASNPTITLTSKSGATATLKIAVNCSSGSAYWKKFDCKNCYFLNGETKCSYACSGNPPGNGCWACSSTKYGCDGAFVLAQLEAAGSNCDQAHCLTYCNQYCGTTPYTQDIRTAEQKTAGCCPAALL